MACNQRDSMQINRLCHLLKAGKREFPSTKGESSHIFRPDHFFFHSMLKPGTFILFRNAAKITMFSSRRRILFIRYLCVIKLFVKAVADSSHVSATAKPTIIKIRVHTELLLCLFSRYEILIGTHLVSNCSYIYWHQQQKCLFWRSRSLREIFSYTYYFSTLYTQDSGDRVSSCESLYLRILLL